MAADDDLFRPVRPVRAYQRVAEQIEERILSGELPPGARLPGERELVQRFGVGRSTVREALRVLQSTGLIRSRPGDPLGAEVLGVSPDNLSQALGRLTRSRVASLGELVHFRMVLDAESNRLAARLHTEEDLRRMREQITRMEVLGASPSGLRAFSEADALFHRAIAEASRNALLGLCARAVHEAVVEVIEKKIAAVADPAAWMSRSINHHREVLTAIEAGDSARAARLGRTALHEYYADHVEPETRELLAAAVADDAVPARPGTGQGGG
ncbi:MULTISPECIES: FadR/GntR family transcriptional regulator [Streptomyces]|uniref:FadR/GntR family transcriptional regulator n=1 Tax=Streptomyces TaxID=1883 RepID=UPI001E2F9988|nr:MULTISPECIES: FadR/GntR family transcriptional regulator [Streptomyces]UFQ14298.1 FadR family transcriptional regulator [Streptomyces huasconensis]WCL83898.1 FadR/GntR family transcriptional regulator [Streptomyces sp. JCM 35825]